MEQHKLLLIWKSAGRALSEFICLQSLHLTQHRFVVAFQIVVESSNVALEYGDLTVDENSPVNPDLHFDSQLMHLYVMTEKKVRKSTVRHINCWHHSVYARYVAFSPFAVLFLIKKRRNGRTVASETKRLLGCRTAHCCVGDDQDNTLWSGCLGVTCLGAEAYFTVCEFAPNEKL